MIRAIGLLLGVGLVLALVLAGRVEGGAASAGAAVTVTMHPSGELHIAPSGVVLTAPDLRPGAAPAGEVVEMRNQTGRSLHVRLRATPSFPDLDRVLWLDVAGEGGPRISAPIGDLREWSAEGFVLAPGEGRRLALRAWIPAGTRDGYESREDDIVLEAQGVPVDT